MVGTKDSAHDEYYKDFDQDPYEEEEALSLCDLPIYSDSFKWDDEFSGSSNKLNQNLSFEENDNEDYFEFFSSDFSSSADFSSGHNSFNNSNKEIIFCGKLIRYKEFPQVENHQKLKISERKQKPRKKKSIFRYWKSSNDDKKSSNDNKKSNGGNKRSENDKSLWSYYKIGKSRWYLYMFGMTRLPRTEMELRDIRSRQSRRLRRSPTTMFPPYDNKGAETTKEKVSSRKPKRRKSRKGWWGLLRVLTCRSQHAEAVAKASIGCGVITRT